jgi:hypothetical protein
MDEAFLKYHRLAMNAVRPAGIQVRDGFFNLAKEAFNMPTALTYE